MSRPDSDRLSDLPESLLLHILSFLPTKSAIRLSLLSRRFRRLWTASPSIHIHRDDFPPGRAFTYATSRCLRLRDSSAPLAAFTLHSWRPLAIKTASRWLTRAYSLGLRTLHLDIYAGDFESLLPLIVTFHSLRCLRISSDHCNFPMPGPHSRSLESTIPPSFLATGLRSLHLKVWISGPDLKRIVMEQTDLEDLCLDIPSSIPLDLASATVKNTKLIFNWGLPGLSLAFPALVVLDLTMSIGNNLKKFHTVMMPLLRKADIKIWSLEEESVPVLGDLLRCLVNVSQLSINIQRSYPR